jgi:hypothetical protein
MLVSVAAAAVNHRRARAQWLSESVWVPLLPAAIGAAAVGYSLALALAAALS